MRFFCPIGALILAVLPGAGALRAQEWGPAQFLIGHWIGTGSGQPGTATGDFSFTPDLAGKVLVRRSFADYPASADKPASRHEDLMVLFHEGSTGELRAVYFDSEDHVIHYTGKASPGGLIFVSDGKSEEVRYRLSYTRTGNDTLKLEFAVAPPGKDFTSYLQATARRGE